MKRGKKHKRHGKNFRRTNRSKRRNFLNLNSYVFNAISFIVLGLLFLRFSSLVFIQWFSWPEGIFWGYLIGAGFIAGGIFSLVAWWRNNVSMFTTKHRVKWN